MLILRRCLCLAMTEHDKVALHFLFQREVLLFEVGDEHEIREGAAGFFRDPILEMGAFFCEGINMSLDRHRKHQILSRVSCRSATGEQFMYF